MSLPVLPLLFFSPVEYTRTSRASEKFNPLAVRSDAVFFDESDIAKLPHCCLGRVQAEHG
jgi:hypothetical protein